MDLPYPDDPDERLAYIGSVAILQHLNVIHKRPRQVRYSEQTGPGKLYCSWCGCAVPWSDFILRGGDQVLASKPYGPVFSGEADCWWLLGLSEPLRR